MDAQVFETYLSVAVGVGLAAACGFRVFVPLLVLNVAARAGHVHLASEFAWITSEAAFIAFAVATVLEILGNSIPAVGSILNALETPASVVAGAMVTAACVTDMSPFLRWTLAVVAGGGSAGLVQGATIAARLPAHAVAPGVADIGASIGEAAGSLVMAVLSIFVPLVAFVVVVLFVLCAVYCWRKLVRAFRAVTAFLFRRRRVAPASG